MPDNCLALLSEVGVSRVRCEIHFGDKGQIAWINRPAQNGIKANVLCGGPENTAGTLEQVVAMVAPSMPGSVQSLEGANEWNSTVRDLPELAPATPTTTRPRTLPPGLCPAVAVGVLHPQCPQGLDL